MKDYYTVKARIRKRWFREPELEYTIQHHYQYWDDPSYGNGGGDYRDATYIIGVFNTVEEAESKCETLNKYNGEKK